MRHVILFVFGMSACTEPPPPLSVVYERDNLGCEPVRTVTVESAPGAVVRLSDDKEIVVGPSGRETALLQQDDDVRLRITATLDGHEEAVAEAKMTRRGFPRGEGRYPAVVYGGVRVWIEGTDVLRKFDQDVEVRFQGTLVPEHERVPIDPVRALQSADLTALADDAKCPFVRLDGLLIRTKDSEAEGGLWVTAQGAHQVLEKGLARLKEGSVIEGAPTADIAAELEYHRVEFHGGRPKRLSDIRWVGDLFYEQKKVGTCGMYSDVSTGKRVRIDRYRSDLVAKIFERHTGKVVVKRRHRGRPGKCSSVQLGSSPSFGKSADKKARQWLRERLKELAS